MKPTELFTAGFAEIKNRLPFATVAKFKRQKIENKTGAQVLSACVSRYNCRIIPIAAVIMIICTFISALLEGGISQGGSAEIAGEVLILVTAVCAVGFGFYFSGRYPAYYPYVFWGLFLLSYCIKVTGCAAGATGLSQTAITIAVLCAVPVFAPAAAALFLLAVPAYYTVVCCINDVSGYYPFTTFGLALLGFLISCTIYTLFCARMINSKRIREDKERIKLSSVMDSRTGLYTRTYGIEQASAMINSGKNAAVLLVDIDRFSEYNRIYGTQKADKVLQQICNCVKIVAKSATDIICRFEGDRLLICMPASSDKEAIMMSEEIRSSIRTMNIPFPENAKYLTVTVTVSAARTTLGDTFDTVFDKAQRSMNTAKRAGGNCIAFKEHTFRPDTEK